jgi:hypothetical protein
VTGEWRKLHNEELHNMYSSPDIIRQVKSRRMRWAGHVARTGEERKLYKVLVGNPEGKRPLGRPRGRWQVKANEVGGACGTHGRGETTVQGFGGKSRRKETARKTGPEWILERLIGGMDCIRLAQDRDRWRAVVSAVMNLRVLVPRS